MGFTVGRGGRLVGVDNRLSAVVLAVGVNSSVGETCCLLVVIQPLLLGRTTGASGT